MVEDRYLEDGAGRTSAQEHRTTLPQSSSLTPKRTAAPHASFQWLEELQTGR